MTGYALGSTISSVDKYLLPIIAVIVVVSLLPLVIEFVRSRKAARTGPGGGQPVSGQPVSGQPGSDDRHTPAEPTSRARDNAGR
jgi:hypothetical protein